MPNLGSTWVARKGEARALGLEGVGSWHKPPEALGGAGCAEPPPPACPRPRSSRPAAPSQGSPCCARPLPLLQLSCGCETRAHQLDPPGAVSSLPTLAPCFYRNLHVLPAAQSHEVGRVFQVVAPGAWRHKLRCPQGGKPPGQALTTSKAVIYRVPCKGGGLRPTAAWPQS